MRRHISLIRLFPWLLHPLAALIVATLASAIWHLAQPTWIELPDSAGEFLANPQRLVITLDGGHYIQLEMRMRPPSDADWDNRIGYPAYVVERGAELVFTDNDSYPDTLVRRQ